MQTIRGKSANVLTIDVGSITEARNRIADRESRIDPQSLLHESPKPRPARHHNRLRPILDLKLCKDIRDVIAHGLLA